MSDPVFEPDGELFAPTELSRGPWDPGALHGGAPAALLMRAFEGLEIAPELTLARITYEFLRPVPLAPLRVVAETVRAGRRVALSEGRIETADGVELVRARALRVHRADVGGGVASLGTGLSRGGPEGSPRGPETGRPVKFFDHAARPMFATDAMEILFSSGDFMSPGPSSAWFRLLAPLVAGEPTSSLQRLAAAADFGNGISAVVPWEDYLFINPDLTLYVGREPVGEWIHLDARTRIFEGGVGVANSALSDEQGAIGHATQALVVQRRG